MTPWWEVKREEEGDHLGKDMTSLWSSTLSACEKMHLLLPLMGLLVPLSYLWWNRSLAVSDFLSLSIVPFGIKPVFVQWIQFS